VTFRDLLVIAGGNLWRMKLRTTLTIAGVLIAIAAFVSMLSFGAGNQAYVEGEFNKLGLLTTMQVFPVKGDETDTAKHPQLDDAALEQLGNVPGVNLVYPYDAIAVSARIGDSTLSTKAQSLPSAAVRTKLFSHLAAGRTFASDSAREAIVSDGFMRDAGCTNPDSLIGLRLVVSVRVSTIDSALAHIVKNRGVTLLDRVKTIHFDSLFRAPYRNRVLRREAGEVARRFVSGFTDAQALVSDTLTICGVRKEGRMGRLRIEDVLIPVATASRFKSGGFGGGPLEIYSAMASGSLFAPAEAAGGRTYPQVTMDYDPKVLYTSIRDSVKKLGFRSFSFAEQFEEIQRVFVYFDLGLGVVGLIALITASLGIANTLIMSINERRREIGVLKSLGADESDIRALFLVESGVIGLFGTAGGIFVGWSITRIVSAVAQNYMKNAGVPPMDLFALPPWLILTALAIGVGVSVVAGFYPAARAARIDPVAALRTE
jgi:putative ABC transport system permease protein